MSGGFEIVAHPSDVGFRAWGPDWSAALDQAVAALSAIETGGSVPAPTGERPVELDGDDVEVLLVQLLEEGLFRVDTEDWLAVGARVVLDDDGVRGVLVGAPLDAASRERGVHVKAITWHQLVAERDADAVRLQVFVDI